MNTPDDHDRDDQAVPDEYSEPNIRELYSPTMVLTEEAPDSPSDSVSEIDRVSDSGAVTETGKTDPSPVSDLQDDPVFTPIHEPLLIPIPGRTPAAVPGLETTTILHPPAKSSSSTKVLRFRKSERIVHWSIAIPFLVCWTSALILVIFYNPDPHRAYRDLFSWIHRISGVCLMTLPPLAITLKRDFRTHFYNIRQAWRWTLDDIKWLFLMGLAAVSSKIHLPDQGKFNAAEKLNFMLVMTTYPLYILTGLVVWLTDVTFLAWLVHFFMALIATPFLVGHIYMAAINPSSRAALSGMLTGFVDRKWAKHHHGHWYREKFESDPKHNQNPDKH